MILFWQRDKKLLKWIPMGLFLCYKCDKRLYFFYTNFKNLQKIHIFWKSRVICINTDRIIKKRNLNGQRCPEGALRVNNAIPTIQPVLNSINCLERPSIYRVKWTGENIPPCQTWLLLECADKHLLSCIALQWEPKVQNMEDSSLLQFHKQFPMINSVNLMHFEISNLWDYNEIQSKQTPIGLNLYKLQNEHS